MDLLTFMTGLTAGFVLAIGLLAGKGRPALHAMTLWLLALGSGIAMVTFGSLAARHLETLSTSGRGRHAHQPSRYPPPAVCVRRLSEQTVGARPRMLDGDAFTVHPMPPVSDLQPCDNRISVCYGNPADRPQLPWSIPSAGVVTRAGAGAGHAGDHQ